MFLNYEVVAAFGVSAVVTFFVAAVLLLMYVAKRGMLRVGARHTPLLPQHAQPQVLTPVELMPLKVDNVSPATMMRVGAWHFPLLPKPQVVTPDELMQLKMDNVSRAS